ncbi:zinc finger C2HC domain-containing protein 1A isoform X2 [Mastacembelus armatus]|uniref:zinc finger C2HC domain-containing protein 1A isoform X2 n=1 Tax=Mastacembelus armatus TaxID=205130 RepID=UPI000E464D50|nr:zinc finger C2HC domain-containing protein 1A isoform X2 [Mastacembelus armatus]
MMDEYTDGGPPSEELTQCNTCKRWFSPKVLQRHAIICQKSTSKKRKVFDSSRQRAEGTDIPTLAPIKPKSQSSSVAEKAETPKKPSNWRMKHENLIATLRAAKASTRVIKEGGPLPPPPPPVYDPDYIQCPYCQRRFNENAADRHIKFCQEQAARMPNKHKLGDVKKPLGRTQYKPSTPVNKVNTSAVSAIPAATSRLQQRSGIGQSTGIPLSKASSGGSVRSTTSSLSSAPSGVRSKTQAVSSGQSSARNTESVMRLNKNKVDSYRSRDYVDGGNQVGNGGMKSMFCHACGTKYPIATAKFCCECGVRKLCI